VQKGNPNSNAYDCVCQPGYKGHNCQLVSKASSDVLDNVSTSTVTSATIAATLVGAALLGAVLFIAKRRRAVPPRYQHRNPADFQSIEAVPVPEPKETMAREFDEGTEGYGERKREYSYSLEGIPNPKESV